MFYFILGAHLVLCLALVFLVLLQQGKGADMGAAFGGGSNTLFGAGGASNLLVKITTFSAVAFFVTSFFLIRAFNDLSAGSLGTATDVLTGSVMEQEAPQPLAESPAEKSAEEAPAAAAPQAAPLEPLNPESK